jgi:Transcriptional regulator, AbiEi antitoxin, Type IV TA system/Transcriptional regulator, AbiEi antitoxin N-terminal domain
VSTPTSHKINWLARHLPVGIPVDAAWLAAQGFSANILRKYEASGWLAQPARRVYIRPRGPILWQTTVIGLQTLLARDLLVGGRTALELQGYAHFLQQDQKQVIYLYGPKSPPIWLHSITIDARFVYRNDGRLFEQERASTAPHTLEPAPASRQAQSHNILRQPWGSFSWPLTLSSPERAILETLDELPHHETFEHLDVLMEGLGTLSPKRLQTLLADCKSVKVKRLFFFFADRHKHPWLKHLHRAAVDLGRGNRSLVKGGRLDRTYKITVPGDLDGAQ